MKILIAPNAFKGSMTAYEAACCIEEGLMAVLKGVEMEKLPIADGGEGTLDALVRATSGTFITEKVQGPLGEIIPATYGILGDGRTAVVEMACASGFSLVPVDARNPMITTTYGTGELVVHALNKGIRRLILGVGGSATVDCGAGMAQALGIRLLDEYGQNLPFGGRGLSWLKAVDTGGMHPALKEAAFEIACDVLNPLTGPNGAARVYGPQKGATPEMVIALEDGLKAFVAVLEQSVGKELASIPGTGAGGGIAVPLLAFTRAEIKQGIEIVLKACDFEKRMEKCDLIITGEGRLDFQTRAGKAPIGIAQKAKEKGIPVIALCGSIGKDAELVHSEGITAFFSALQYPVKEQELSEKGPEMLRLCARQTARLLKSFSQFDLQ